MMNAKRLAVLLCLVGVIGCGESAGTQGTNERGTVGGTKPEVKTDPKDPNRVTFTIPK